MRVELRPTTAEDLAAFIPVPVPYRVMGITGIVDGHIIGIGGLVFRPDGVWATIVLSDQARRYPTAMHRAARMTMAMARERRIPCVLAKAEDGRAGAAAWLERLGFKPTTVSGEPAFIWKSQEHGG